MNMKNIFITLCFLCSSSVAYADLTIKTNDTIQDQLDLIQVEEGKQIVFGEDILATAINYPSFVVGLQGFAQAINEGIKNKDYNMVCEYNEMISEYLINNIKYSEEFNRSQNKPNYYQRLLTAINKDILDNKKGCDGEAYFIK